MTKIHFLNVKQGDCIIIEHESGRITVFDICAGNIDREQQASLSYLTESRFEPAKGNFRMCDHPTNPLDYLSTLTSGEIWRFILSHPDMDHLDGFNALLNEFNVRHFWDSGVEREKPEFGPDAPYKEVDWDRYAKVKSNKQPETRSISKKAGDSFEFANLGNPDGSGDRLHILAPDEDLISKANETQDFNDASYVVLCKSPIGKVLLTGDAHDGTWKYIENHYKDDVSDVDLLIAPHHGRKSGRSYDFLDYVNPKLTLFGCAPSEHLAYDAWNYRGLDHITNNQCGCVVAEGSYEMNVYVENDKFAEKSGGITQYTNAQGYYFLKTVG